MLTDPLAQLLSARRTAVLDGGLATELEARGGDLRDPLWSAKLLVENPSLIRDVHAAYFDAGADVAISASYQASFEGFAAHGMDRGEAEDLMRLSVLLAREARDACAAHEASAREAPAGAGGQANDRLVAASVGPYGAVLGNGAEYTGDYGRTADELVEFHLPRMEVLASAGADILAIETIPSVVEAEALVRTLERIPEARAWFSFSCRDGERICDGTTFAAAVGVAASSDQVVAVGANCTAPQHISSLVAIATAATSKPVLVYPNRGAFWDAVRRSWVDPPRQDPRPTLRPAAWAEAGARLIGGCCGVGPSDIRGIAEALGR